MKFKKILSLLIVMLLTVFMSGGSLLGFTAKANENMPDSPINAYSDRSYIAVGSTAQLSAIFFGDGFGNMYDNQITWSTPDTNIVSIDKTGIVKGLSIGSAKITAASQDGHGNAEITIHVISKEEDEANVSAANAVIAKISALPDDKHVTLADEAIVDDVEKAFNKLTDAQKELVSNIQKYDYVTGAFNGLMIQKEINDELKKDPTKVDNNKLLEDIVFNALDKRTNYEKIKLPSIDITNNPIVSFHILNYSVLKDFDVMNFVSKNVSWSFYGNQLLDADLQNDVDLSLKTVSNELREKETAKAKDITGKDVKIAPFSFNYSCGNGLILPSTASVKVLTSKDWAGKTVDLYRYNKDKNSCEKVQSNVKTDADGYITFTTNYGGDYFIVDIAASTNTDSKTISIVNNPSVSKDVFNGIKGSDKSVTFTGSNVIWTFSGKDITSEVNNDIDLSLKTVSDGLKSKEAAKIKDAAGKDVSFVPFSFTYDGPLPGTASIKVLISKDWAGKTVNVYRYHEDTNSYELIQSDITVDKDGYITYNTNHCSDYFVADASSLPKSDSQNNSNTNTASTTTINSDTSAAKTNSTETAATNANSANAAQAKVNSTTTITTNTAPVKTNSTVTTAANAKSNNTAKTKLPKTGSSIDSLRVMGIGILFIALGSIVTIICSRKKKKAITK